MEMWARTEVDLGKGEREGFWAEWTALRAERKQVE